MEVTLVSYTQNPDAVVEMAAKTCVSEYMPELSLAVNKRKSMEHALESGHTSVLDHVSFTFAIEGISRACSHQLVRQRIGVGISQQSQRYVNMENFEYVIPESIQNNIEALRDYEYFMTVTNNLYKILIDHGIPEEDARYILPNACTTNLTFTLSGTALRAFLMRRMCNRAQWEIREVAKAMYAEVEKVAPAISEYLGRQCYVLGRCPERKPCDVRD